VAEEALHPLLLGALGGCAPCALGVGVLGGIEAAPNRLAVDAVLGGEVLPLNALPVWSQSFDVRTLASSLTGSQAKALRREKESAVRRLGGSSRSIRHVCPKASN
jgi:hypothetical protein